MNEQPTLKTVHIDRLRPSTFVAVWILLSAATIGCASTRVRSVATLQPRQAPGYVVRHEGARRVLVFVHGFTGDGNLSWQSDTGVYWPSLVGADATFRDFDVYAYDYRTSLIGDCMSVPELANQMRLRLSDVFREHEQIVFLAHSMGGLVVRQFLVGAKDNLTRKVPLALFFATPTGGADEAALVARIPRTCRQAEDLRNIDSNTYLDSVRSIWKQQALDRLVYSYCAIETVGDRVKTASASLLCDNNPVPLDADHSRTVKPRSDSDDPHLVLREAVREHLVETFTGSANRPAATPDQPLPNESQRARAGSPALIDVSNASSITNPLATCPSIPSDTKPNVSLRTGDLVIVGSGELVVLSQTKATTIASDGYLAEARGVAVDNAGRIYISGTGCGGAVVRVDPASGTQTPVDTGYGRPMGLAFDPTGKLLVGVENGGGEIYRLDFSTGSKERLPVVFTPRMGVHSIALYPETGDIYVADGPAFRIDSQSYVVNSVQVAGVSNVQALAIQSSGEIFIGENGRAAVVQAARGQRDPVKTIESSAFSSFWGLALSADEKSLYASTGAGLGGVYKMNLPLDGSQPTEIWKPTRKGNQMFFVTVVKLVRQR